MIVSRQIEDGFFLDFWNELTIEMTRIELENYLDQLLSPQKFEDYAPNGLQVEGKAEIKRIAFSVSATLESIDLTLQFGADALLVHHGLFWKFQGAKTLTGAFAKRVYPLVRHGISLFAYHLPLDAHPEVGNAAAIADRIGLIERAPFGDFKGSPTGIQGLLPRPRIVREMQQELERVLDHPVLLASPDREMRMRSVGVITGGANHDWVYAARANLDAFITGEMSEHDWHDSREAGIHMFAGGHHATERFGIQTLMKKIQRDFSLECRFFDSQNPA